MGDMTPRIFTQHGKTYLHIPGLTAGPRASRRPSCRHSWENWWTDEDGTDYMECYHCHRTFRRLPGQTRKARFDGGRWHSERVGDPDGTVHGRTWFDPSESKD